MLRKVCFVLLNVIAINATVVTVEHGTLNGTHLTSRDGRLFNAFFGIPFAEPPLGNLRFKGPIEPKPWTEVRDASVIPSMCVQIPEGDSVVTGDEDCLYLNVYSPLDVQKGNNLTVIVYLYGGVFKFSGNKIVGANYVLDRNVIFVVPNFRGGALGFLSTGDEVIPGNFGLKDQNMALKWVQKNIYDFGGDPNKVTVQGHSSGAISAHLHTLSPKSKGLFQKVIIQSGTAICSMSYFGPDVARNVAKEFAVRAGCPTNSSEDMLNCFLEMDAYDMPLIQEEMYVWDKDPDAVFRPTIENENIPDAFIMKIPNYMDYHSPDQPWMIGVSTAEALFKIVEYLSDDGELAAQIDQYYKLLFPITIQYLWNTQPNHLDYTSEVIKTHYVQNRTIGPDTAFEMTEMYTDGLFGYCAIDAILKYPGPKHVYLYGYSANFSPIPDNFRYLGVSHGEDMFMFIYKEDAESHLTPQDIMFSKEWVKRLVNFAESGNPNSPVGINEDIMSVWEPMSSRRIEYLLIELNGKMQTDFYKGTYQFWKSLPIGSKYFEN